MPKEFAFRHRAREVSRSEAFSDIVFGLGFASIFLLYALLYHHAFKKRDDLELNLVEQHDTITHVMMFGGNVAIGLASILIAQMAPDRFIGFAGFIYFLIGVVSGTIGTMRGSQRHRVEAEMLSDSTSATSTQTIQAT